MEVRLRDNGVVPNIKDIILRKDNKTFKIFYGGNGDLYFDIYGSYEEHESMHINFEIDKEDEIYPFFANLIDDIKETRVFEFKEIDLMLCQTNEEVVSKIKCINQNNDELKKDRVYKNLVKDNRIEFYSDSIYNEKANHMTMEIINNKIVFNFYDNPKDYIEGFAIRINNSGSKYMPFNICFMRLFNEMHDYLISKKENNIQKKIGTI